MDIQNDNDDDHVSGIPMNIVQEQYVFADQIDTFDSNLTSATNYCTQLEDNSDGQQIVAGPFHAFSSNYNGIQQTNSDISLVPATELPNNCITYSNVILVPTITNDENQLNQIVDTIELVKNETDTSAAEIKYVLSSDSRFVNSFIHTNDLNNASTVLNTTSTDPFGEQPSQLISTISQIHETDQINQQLHHAEAIDQNHITVQMHAANNQEVLLQDEHGQLYRQIQNLYVDGTSMCSNEMLPIISAPVGIPDVEFVDQNLTQMQNTYQQKDDQTFQIPVNFVTNSDSNQTTSNTIDTNSEMQEVEFIFNSYRNSRTMDEIRQPNSNHIDPNQYGMESNSVQQNYQSHIDVNSNKDDQRLLESTMSTLLAAVNDIAAREQQLEAAREEQFRSYLNTSKSSVSDNSLDYYSDSPRVENVSTAFYKSTPIKSTEVPKVATKPMTLASVTNELFSNRCDSPADEYVDINEMEFIEKKNEEGQREENILLRRSRRKRTIKRKDDELLVSDKVVQCRALATLPTSYLYFEAANCDGSNGLKHKVLTKRDIPLRMKFGPFVGETKTLSKHEMKKYRESNPDYPLLFLSSNSILDTSNEHTSNWMRFVRLAKKHDEQNLLLCEIDSQLYFKCCKFIAPKQELRVGYSKDYAKKYHLLQLLPEPSEFICKKCDVQFASAEQLLIHENEHKTNDKIYSVPRITPVKCNDTISPTKGKDRLNTRAIRMSKLALSKNSRASGPIVRYACCYCSKVFSRFLSYKNHTNRVHSVNIEHKRVTMDTEHKRLTIEDSITDVDPIKMVEKNNPNAKHIFVCQQCQQQFETGKELEDHRYSCSNENSLTMQCHICLKHLQTPSAFTAHIKKHSSAVGGIFMCPFCSQRYQMTTKLKAHVKTHMVNGTYTCPHCPADFPKYSSIRKHIKDNHSEVRFVCHECGKNFKSKYKLKEHSLSHSDVRRFSCADCDKQFKRKDKLRAHILRVHVKNSTVKKRKKLKESIDNETFEPMVEEHLNDESIDSNDEKVCYMDSTPDEMGEPHETHSKESADISAKQKFQPKVPPTDFERFIYKCQHCMLGFKRRGMLVNHMAKRHPDIRIESIHELNLPILKTERCFYCLYCEKVYKSSSKRKAHILKYHPGQQLPQSTRHRTENCDEPREPDASFSANIGSITTHAHQCMWCYKQYASRSRLLQHKRKDHSKELEDTYKQNQTDYFKELNMIMDSHESQFHTQSIDEYSMRFNEMNEHVSNSVHRFHHIEYEPENRLLELSSAALEASIRDDYSFLSDSDVNNDVIGQDIMDSREDVNFKCDSNTLPQLFDGFLQ